MGITTWDPQHISQQYQFLLRTMSACHRRVFSWHKTASEESQNTSFQSVFSTTVNNNWHWWSCNCLCLCLWVYPRTPALVICRLPGSSRPSLLFCVCFNRCWSCSKIAGRSCQSGWCRMKVFTWGSWRSWFFTPGGWVPSSGALEFRLFPALPSQQRASPSRLSCPKSSPSWQGPSYQHHRDTQHPSHGHRDQRRHHQHSQNLPISAKKFPNWFQQVKNSK